MTRELDSPGTRIRGAGFILPTLARLAAIALAIPATLALIQVTGRVLTGEFPLAETWLGEIIVVYVQSVWIAFDSLSPRDFNELDPVIQGLLIFLPNLTLVFLGILSAIHLIRSLLKGDYPGLDG
jgi:hypothetical protein